MDIPSSEPDSPPATDKPLRAHALRNRNALPAAAREMFTGGEVDIRIEETARRAGVGVGTLYRHFATREALLEAVYRQHVEEMASATAAFGKAASAAGVQLCGPCRDPRSG